MNKNNSINLIFSPTHKTVKCNKMRNKIEIQKEIAELTAQIEVIKEKWNTRAEVQNAIHYANIKRLQDAVDKFNDSEYKITVAESNWTFDKFCECIELQIKRNDRAWGDTIKIKFTDGMPKVDSYQIAGFGNSGSEDGWESFIGFARYTNKLINFMHKFLNSIEFQSAIKDIKQFDFEANKPESNKELIEQRAELEKELAAVERDELLTVGSTIEWNDVNRYTSNNWRKMIVQSKTNKSVTLKYTNCNATERINFGSNRAIFRSLTV